MNQSIISGIFPEAWNLATVIPLSKVNNPSGVSDYRPISSLPLPGKLREKLLHGQLIEYLENNNLLTNKQNGFRKNHNTNDTAFKLVHGLSNDVNKQSHFCSFCRLCESLLYNRSCHSIRQIETF